MFLSSRRSAVALVGAALLSLVVAGQAFAAHSWSGRISLSSSVLAYEYGVAGLNSNTAVAVLLQWNGSNYDVATTRSVTSGTSWSAPSTIASRAASPAIAGRDPHVDVVWSHRGRVIYARSDDDGATFGPHMRLSGRNFAGDLSVARGPGGLVVVAWQNGHTDKIKVRVSTDGGDSFGAATTFNSHAQDMGTAVAAGNGVAYIAYKTKPSRLVVRRSTDGGASWSSATVATTDGYGINDQLTLTASGSVAYLAYATNNSYHPAFGAIRYRRTLDSGASWSAERNIAPPKWKTGFPDISLQGSKLRAVFARKTSTGYGVYYRQSGNGLHWSTIERVDGHNALDPAVTWAGNIIVVFEQGLGEAFAKTGS